MIGGEDGISCPHEMGNVVSREVKGVQLKTRGSTGEEPRGILLEGGCEAERKMPRKESHSKRMAGGRADQRAYMSVRREGGEELKRRRKV